VPSELGRRFSKRKGGRSAFRKKIWSNITGFNGSPQCREIYPRNKICKNLINMTAIEHTELRGITIKNMLVTVVSTASIVASLATAYYNLKNDITGVKNEQNTENKVYDMRLKIVESEIAILQTEVHQMREHEHNKENNSR
jgi:hypothetical protein